MTIHRRGFLYVTEQPDGLPGTIGRPEAMAIIRQAHNGALPMEYNFDVVRRHYWRFEAAEVERCTKLVSS